MIDFLIKSSVGALVLLVAYHLFLEREKMHRFNRFFLLFAIVFSFAIPFITIEIISKVVQATTIQQMPFIQTDFTQPIEEIDYTPYILWVLYGIGLVFFSFRFVSNLIKINQKKNTSIKVKFQNAHLALVKEKTLPHTFGNTIFINETDYNNRNIEAELYTHELTHVLQKHTLDVLFIETVKTIFWFNPIFAFYKKAMQLNHEFLADEKVVAVNNDVPFYQKLLLSKANFQTINLASNLNYSLTKKRLIMMTKTTSATAALLRKITILPLLSALVFFLCTETVAQETQTDLTNQTQKSQTSKEKRNAAYFTGTRIIVYKCGWKTPKKDRSKAVILDKLYEELTSDERTKYAAFLIAPERTYKKSPTDKELKSFKNAKNYAIWIDGKNVPNTALNKYKPTEIAYFSGSVILKNARTKKHPQPFQYWFYTHAYFDKTEMGKEKKKYSGDTIEIFAEDAKAANKKFAKTKIATEQEDEIFTTAEQKPEPKDGFEKFYGNFSHDFKVPTEIKGKATIFAQFVVEKSGAITNIKILRSAGFGSDEEVTRVLKNSDNWLPGKTNGKAVRVAFTLPITIMGEE
ncbi:MAG: M56 family metallopeptidase [Flavobacterium sp.]|nr:M56 family metallopeptidase [Flavobacterium sp.]